MANYNFNLKDKSTKEETPINLIIRWENKKLKYSTLEKVAPSYFENDKAKRNYQRIKSSYVGHPEFNARLDHIEATARSAFRQFINDNHRSPDPQELKELLDIKLRRRRDKKDVSLFEFIENLIIESETKGFNKINSKKLSPGTIRIYKNTLARLREFQSHYKKRIDFNTVDLELYDAWVDFLSRHLGLSLNTTGRFVKTFKHFLNEATDRGINTNFAFKNKRWKVLTETVNSIYLNENELEELYALDLSENKKLERVRDLFIVGCWTGLRYGDLSNVSRENIKEDFIEIKTQKTGNVVVLPLHRMVKEIINKYKDYPNSLPPSISNVKFNAYIKLVAELVPSLHEAVSTSITRGGEVVSETKKKYQLVTVHTARRSMCTNLYLQNVNSLVIMKLSGHRSERVFLSYLKATNEQNARLVQQHWQKHEQQKAREQSKTVTI